MKVFVPLVAIVVTLCGTLAQTNQGSNGLNLLDELTWRVASKSDDHITYVRRTPDQEVDLKKLLNIDCNDTTTTPAPQTSASPALSALRTNSQRTRGNAWRSQAQRGENLQLRSGGAEGLRRRGSSTSSGTGGDSSATGSSGLSTRGQTSSSSHTYEGEGDAWWIVTHRTDDHITYTRKNATLAQSQQGSGTTGQGQDQEDGLQQGKLTKIGSGSDSVLVRVVNQNEELTEEGLLAGRGQQQNLRSGATGGSRGGYPTSELVHPYVKKTNKTLKALRSGSTGGSSSGGSRREGLKSLNQSGARGGRRGLRGGSPAALTETASTTAATKEDDHPPRVGDEVNGWRVIAKTKESISWERVGSTSTSTTGGAGAGATGLELRSLDSLSGSGSSSSTRSRGVNVRSRADRNRAEEDESAAWRATNAQRQLIPSAEGELVEGFPRVFNTYSRSLFGNESDIENAGTIRTSLTNTTNWNVGDELAGWRVIGKDYRGIIWEKITNKTATFNNGLDGVGGEFDESEDDEDYILNEEDLLGEFNKALKSGQGGDLEDSAEDGDGLSYKVPPGTWYLAKETKNKVTWKRDGVPDTVVFDKEAYPRVGDVDSVGQWKVESKSKEQITWVRINSLKDE